jgi:ribosome maturation factor RimP
MSLLNMTSSDDRPDDLQARLTAITEEVVSAHESVYIVEIDIRGQKGSRVVNVYLEGDGPLNVENLATISREISFVLETEDIIAGRYHLNVSSPGADRPLRMPRQYRKHVGRQMQVTRREADGVDREVVGTLTSADDEMIVLSPEKGDPIEINYQEIETARVRLPW